jgi:uncharacterized membrane protein (DUF2068 family)
VLEEVDDDSPLSEFDKLFALTTRKLYLYGIALAAYAEVNGIEAVGLWRARRWAEYLTLLEVAVPLPIEIHELTVTVSPLNVLRLVLNLAVVGYLLSAHRLFGVRGGGRAARAERKADTGWDALRRATPWLARDVPSEARRPHTCEGAYHEAGGGQGPRTSTTVMLTSAVVRPAYRR